MLTDAQRQSLQSAFDEVLPAGARGITGPQVEAIAARTHLPLRVVEYFALARGIVPHRYDRNIPAISSAQQARLLDSSAAVVGLGGLGGHVVECLARLGVGRILGIDGDSFVESNLNRQVLATGETLGEPKAEQARIRVAAVNPAVEFVACQSAFQDLAPGALTGVDAVLDCLDGIPARRDLAALCAACGLPLIHGAIGGWSGQVGLCPPGGDLIDKLYAGEKTGVEKRLGNLPFTAAVAGHLMAARAARLLMNPDEPQTQRLLLFDLLDDDWQTIDL
jgi:molybdopterin/thiamine biosynthesis adenylyltransferase